VSHAEAVQGIIDKLQVWADECAIAPDFPAYAGDDEVSRDAWVAHFATKRAWYLASISFLKAILGE
jgi:hypothetical protein